MCQSLIANRLNRRTAHTFQFFFAAFTQKKTFTAPKKKNGLSVVFAPAVASQHISRWRARARAVSLEYRNGPFVLPVRFCFRDSKMCLVIPSVPVVDPKNQKGVVVWMGWKVNCLRNKCVSLCSSMSTGDWDLFLGPLESLNGRGRRLVELTDWCYSEGDSHGLLGWIK